VNETLNPRKTAEQVQYLFIFRQVRVKFAKQKSLSASGLLLRRLE